LRLFFIINNRAHTHTHVHSYFLVRVIDHFRMERLPFYFLWHTNCMEGLSFLGSPKVFFSRSCFFSVEKISCSCWGDMIKLCRYVTLSFASALCGGWDVITFRFTCKCIMWVEELLVCPRFPLNTCLFAPFNSLCSTIKACIE